MSQRDFPNLELVNESVLLLYRSLRAAYIKKEFSTNLLPATVLDCVWNDPVIATQTLARHIALHFRLAISTVVVTFTSNLPMPGRVELSNSSSFFIDIDAEHQSDPECISAILAHEIAHIFLHRHRIRVEPESRNEVLTDTTAAYLGCGVLIMSAAWKSSKGHSQHFGYLTLDEFGYLLAKRDLFFGHDSSGCFSPGVKLESYCAGRERLRWECANRPFVPRRDPGRLTRWVEGKLRRQNAAATVFRCPCCTQSLRIPSAGSVLSVHCPTCDSSFRCYP